MRGIERDGDVWIYRPASHKTANHGHEPVIHLDRKAQDAIKPFLRADLEAPLLDPCDAIKERIGPRSSLG